MKNQNQSSNDENLLNENDLLKAKLTEEFGMSEMGSNLPPDMENDWLNYLYSFEKQYAENNQIKIYDLIGRPDFKNIEQLKEEEIGNEIDRLMDIMEENSIILDLLCEYEDKVIYKFITEELFQEEITDIRIKGMRHHFIYEEFHPNHEYDIKEDVKNLLESILKCGSDHKYFGCIISDTIEYDNKEMTKNDFMDSIEAFKNDIKPAGVEMLKFHEVRFDLDKCSGRAEGEITFSLKENDSLPAHVSGEFSADLNFNEFGFWEIRKLKFPETGL